MTFQENVLQYDDYFHLRQSVNWNNYSKEQTLNALKHTIYSITVKKDQQIIAMGRLIGDGLYFTIVDVIVCPDFQRQGIGTAVIHKLLDFAKKSTLPGGRTSISLIAAIGKEPFYDKLGFKRIPHEYCGSGMRKVIYKENEASD